MSWIYLGLAICLEVIGTTCMKLSNGLTNISYVIGMLVSYVVCFMLLSLALKTIDMSIAYAIWAALGIVLISTIGIVFFGENLNMIKILSTLFIIIGVVGLKLSGSN